MGSEAGVGGLLHFLLPESRINPQRAADPAGGVCRHRHSAAVPGGLRAGRDEGADARAAGRRRRDRRRHDGGGTFNVGKRNLLAAQELLWRNGVLIEKEEVGGRTVRTVHMTVNDGRVQVSTGRDVVVTL